MNTIRTSLLVALLPLALSGCEQLGMEDPVKIAAMREAEGRAVGSGCRHGGKSLEECYQQNRRESKAAIFSGWREMDGYMRENNIPTMNPDGTAEASPEKSADKTADKAEEKPEAKAEADTKEAKEDAGKGATDKPAATGKKTVALERETRTA